MVAKLILSTNKVKLAMANACLDPYGLCEKSEIHYSTLLRIEKGKPIKTGTAGKIAKGLGLKVEDLLEENET